MHGVVPAHVAGHNLVVVVPVLNIVRERVVVGVCGGFGCVCNKKNKERREWVRGEGPVGWIRKVTSSCYCLGMIQCYSHSSFFQPTELCL